MDDKPLYITLEAQVPVKGAEDGVPLVRKVEATYMDKTVYDAMQKIIDPEADALNEPYNHLEKQTATTVKDWFVKMNNDPDNYSVSVLSFDKDGTDIALDLDKRLGDYESIVKYKQESINDPETGETINERYKYVELFARLNVPSGLESKL